MTRLAYIIRMSITVQTYGEYPMYATTDDEMIARMLHLPPDKNKLLPEKDVQRVHIHMAGYRIDNRTFRLCSTLCCLENSEQMIAIFVVVTWHILYFPT